MNTPYFVTTPEGVSRLWEPTRAGLMIPSEGYIAKLKSHGVQISNSLPEAQSFGILPAVAAIAGVSAKGLQQNVSRRGLFSVVGGILAGATVAQLLSADRVMAQFGGAGSDSFILLVLSDPSAGLSPADSTTYYYGSNIGPGTGNQSSCEQVVPVSCTLSAFSSVHAKTGTTASGENVTHYARKNDTTDSTGATAAWDNAAGATKVATETGINLAFSAGDLIMGKIATPAWVTNPTGCRLSGTAYFTK